MHTHHAATDARSHTCTYTQTHTHTHTLTRIHACRWMEYPGRGYDVRHPHDASIMTYRGHRVGLLHVMAHITKHTHAHTHSFAHAHTCTNIHTHTIMNTHRSTRPLFVPTSPLPSPPVSDSFTPALPTSASTCGMW